MQKQFHIVYDWKKFQNEKAGNVTRNVEVNRKIFYNERGRHMSSIFEEEVREKKQQRHLYKAKTNGRRKSGSMLPMDFMSKAQQKEYTKAGEIVVTNLWDQIITVEQYEALTDEKKKAAMEHWRKIHTTAAIRKAFKWNSNKTYKEFDRLGIEKAVRKPRTATGIQKAPAAKKEKPAAKINDQLLAFDDYEPEANKPLSIAKEERIEQVEARMIPAANTGSTLFFDDTISAEEAITKLMKYAAFLEGESHKFRLRLEITEIKK